MYLIKRPILQRRLSRKEVFIRDNYAFLHCERETKQLTVDHVMPRFRGGLIHGTMWSVHAYLAITVRQDVLLKKPVYTFQER